MNKEINGYVDEDICANISERKIPNKNSFCCIWYHNGIMFFCMCVATDARLEFPEKQQVWLYLECSVILTIDKVGQTTCAPWNTACSDGEHKSYWVSIDNDAQYEDRFNIN